MDRTAFQTAAHSPFVSNLLSISKVGPYLESKPHRHDCWEIGLYLRGSGLALVGARQVPFAPGTLICYPPAVAHSERADEACLGFFIQAERCPFGARELPVCADRSWRSFLPLMDLLHAEYRRRQPYWEDAAERLLDLLCIEVRRKWASPAPIHSLVTALRLEIERRADDPDFYVSAALARLPMSPDHLRRLFTRAVGRGPLAHLQQGRIARAKSLLREGRWRVKEVAARVGIPDEHYFSRLFFKLVGQRPGTYGRGERFQRRSSPSKRR